MDDRLGVKSLGLALIAIAIAGCREAPLDLAPAPVTVAPPAPIDLAAVVPNDPDLREGALPNGVRFDILPVPGALRTQVWLVVGAGSLAEDDDQRGLAHLVEHLAFEGTTHFPGHAIRDVVERSGMASGDDLNATTTYDATTYKLAVPADDPALLATGLDVLRDWASEVTFDPAAIDHERRVVAEERRQRAGDGGFDDAVRDYVLRGSRHAVRAPIGDPTVVATAPREALLRFYRDWYRPDLMTVIVVGDVDAAAVEAQIRSRFAGLVGPGQPRALPHEQIHVRDGEVVAEVHGYGSAAVIEQAVDERRTTFADLRRELIEGVRMRALEIVDEGTGESTEIRSFSGARVRVELAWRPSAALERLAVARRGILDPSAIARARRDLAVAAAESAGADPDPAAPASALAERAVSGGQFVGARRIAGYVAQLAPGITDAEIATRAPAPTAVFFLDGGREDHANVLYETRLALEQANAGTLGVHEHEQRAPIASGVLPAAEGAPGTIAAERIMAAADAAPRSWLAQATARGRLDPAARATRRALGPADVLEWRLSNGARVLIKPTSARSHRVGIIGMAPGGASLSPDEVPAAIVGALLVTKGGPSTDHDGFARAARAAGIDDHGVTIDGGYAEVHASGRSGASVEALLQVVHAYMRATGPRDGLGDLMFDVEATRAGPATPPEFALPGELKRALTDTDSLEVPLSKADVTGLDPARALAIYRERFGDASAFTFVITGDIDPVALRPLVETYLAGLPAIGAPPAATQAARPWHAGDQTIVRHGGGGDRATITVAAWSTATVDYARKRDLLLLQLLLQARVRELLRDELAEVYTVDVDVSLAPPPARRVTIAIDFSCAPAHAEALATAVRGLLDQLRDGAITADDSARVIAQVRRIYEGWVGDATYWQQELASRALYGLDPAGIVTDPRRVVADLDLARTRAIAHELLSLGGTATGILLPK